MLTTVRRGHRAPTVATHYLLEELESRVFLSAVPAPLTSVDVGTPTGGSASYNTGTSEFTLVGAGFDIFGASDAFHYVYQPLTGNGSVVVRVDSDSPNGERSLAGLDIRSSLNTSAANMWLATRDDGQVFVDDRTTDGGVGTNVVLPQPAMSYPIYLKLTRSGNSVTAASSSDGVNYTMLITDTINLPGTAFVGMATSSQNAPTMLTTATYGAFAVTGTTPTPPTTTPTATLTSPPTITVSTTTSAPFTVTYNDSAGINASTIGNGNLIVTGPGGYSHPATLASTGLTNATSVAATYNLNPVPTTPGTYTITSLPNQVADVNGNALPGGTVVGTFVVSAPAASTGSITGGVIFADGTILQGRTVFLDTNGDGMLDNGEPSTVSADTSGYRFDNLAAGTYKVEQVPSQGQQLLEPTGGIATVTVATGQTSAVPNFVDIASDAAGATTNLKIAFTDKTRAARLGGTSRVSVVVTSTGALAVHEHVRIAVLATRDGTIANKADAIAFAYVNLKAKSSQKFNLPVKYKQSLGAGSYKLVAVVDPDGVVGESSKLDNTAVSNSVTVTASI